MSTERKESLYYLREHIGHHAWNAGINTNMQGVSGEVSDGNEGQVIRNWKKGDPYYKVAKKFLNYAAVFSAYNNMQ